MAIQVALHHKTEYRYHNPVNLLPQVVRLRPAPHCRTPILSYALKVEPADHFINWQQDPYGNYLARLVFPKPTQRFAVEVDLIAQMVAINPFDFFVEDSALQCPFAYAAELRQELLPYFEIKETGPALTQWVASVRGKPADTNDYLVELNRRTHAEIRYIIRMEPGIQTCEETLTKKSGSCRDSAWLLVQTLRHLGLAARFVSGYLIQLVADMPALDGPSGPTRDFTDLHAWAEVYLPGAGWVGLDPTSALLTGEGHLPLACTADPTSAAPITGSFQWTPPRDKPDSEVSVDFGVAMSVRRVEEPARVTKPYTDEQWKRIDALGNLLEDELDLEDVRLTMGGEPTFVGIDDRDAAEWNTAALGPHKRQRGNDLLLRLRDLHAPQGLLHFGQGKWYPGESLPRWAMACYWRTDGEPIWRRPQWLAEVGRDYKHGPGDAQRFIENLAERLCLPNDHCMPAYEDVWYYLWSERRLPLEADPLVSNLDDPEERVRLAWIFEQGLDRVVGYALPIRKAGVLPEKTSEVLKTSEVCVWESGRWELRREHLYLLPGDSPMGYRLPLDSLGKKTSEVLKTSEVFESIEVRERDPWEPRPALPALQLEPSRNGSLMHRHGSAQRVADSLVRTTLCVEPREGRLHVFMPPVGMLEDYLELIKAIEDTAADLQLPVQIEGYPPPHDTRLAHFKVTPDPGVLEVNVQPARDWRELVSNVTSLYEAARQSRLSTEKFMLDGRHTGTGGGNHIVLGGAEPADSPILRRPDLLRSLVGYWHNHPALSYLFSGIFMGPTSQAPRVDEARNDSVHELEIAFAKIPDYAPVAPWLVDRVFRNLLVDVTGNTHRTEWCIDKLYSPDSSTGRLGLVEFRGFEMPPHAQMSLVQHLLVRALILRFWQVPYRERLVRWGTQLHDRFLLPHFVAQDFRDVVDELRRHRIALEHEWFAPHYEFRFPVLGSLTVQGVTLELRQALEPWPVLGEETRSNGTVRNVDSSLERVQVLVRGLIDPRHQVTCNGRKVPLHPTGVSGEYAAGVRYRAWQPPSCLHPTIPVHVPLIFDLLDTWLKRSLGGCAYHVSHPGGRSHERFPVNAPEAEGRRLARFSTTRHTMGTFAPPREEVNPEFPLTLDLRCECPADSVQWTVGSDRSSTAPRRDRVTELLTPDDSPQTTDHRPLATDH